MRGSFLYHIFLGMLLLKNLMSKEDSVRDRPSLQHQLYLVSIKNIKPTFKATNAKNLVLPLAIAWAAANHQRKFMKILLYDWLKPTVRQNGHRDR